MQKTITALATYINPFMRRYVCPCGHTSKGRQAALRHLETHPAGTIGSMDYETGAVAF